MKLSTKEKIERIEKAPKEVQTMVAKAYLRDDIPDEQVQYLFNTTPLEEMNDKSVIIENVNAKTPEGVGTVGFTMRTSMPSGNKQYITRNSGGWSSCIKGNPMQENANVLANCVGYASGRFNELIEYARDYHECTYSYFNCNASLFTDVASYNGFTVADKPRVGAIMVWGGGYEDCGHVAVVERVDNDNQVYTSESDWGGTAFFNALRNNDNGRWGLASNFYFKGFIYQEPDVQAWINGGQVVEPVEPDKNKNQIEIKPSTTELYVRTAPNGDSGTVGLVQAGKYYNYYDMTSAGNYTWVKLAENQWIIYASEWEILHPAQEEEKTQSQIEKDFADKILDKMPEWLNSLIEE